MCVRFVSWLLKPPWESIKKSEVWPYSILLFLTLSKHCSFAYQSKLWRLEHVDRSDVVYTVEGSFLRPPDGAEILTFGDLKHRSLRIEVVEDDADGCPVPANLDPDDQLGTEVISGLDLFTPKVMRFDKVIHLKLGREQ